MLFKRKFNKLKKTPYLFIKDSSVIRLVSKKTDTEKIHKESKKNKEKIVKTKLVNELEINQPDYTTSRLPLEKFDFDFVSNLLFKSVPFFTIDKKIICIYKRDFISFVKTLSYESIRNNIIVNLKDKKSIKSPKTFKQLYENIENKRIIDFLIGSHQSIDTVEFQLQLWEQKGLYLEAPCPNIISRRIYPDSLGKLFPTNDTSPHELKEILKYPIEEDVSFPIDAVISWVDSENLEWQELYRQYSPKSVSDATSMSRFKNRNELKYCLRGIELYAPWINNIYIVSNCPPPAWINMENEQIYFINHEQIIDSQYLPTFNSHAIEANIHHIPNLSEHFIYFNDDMLLSRPTSPSDFFLSNGIAKVRFEKYGNVNGDLNSNNPDYLNASRNSTRLIEEEFHRTPTELHTHSPISINKSIVQIMEDKFTDAFQTTSSHKFRDITDINLTSYFYPHYSYGLGHSIKDYSRIQLIKDSHDFVKIYASLINYKKSRSNKLPLSICVNDGLDSYRNELWNKETLNFMDTYYPDKSSFEL